MMVNKNDSVTPTYKLIHRHSRCAVSWLHNMVFLSTDSGSLWYQLMEMLFCFEGDPLLKLIEESLVITSVK